VRGQGKALRLDHAGSGILHGGVLAATYSDVIQLRWGLKGITAMEEIDEDKWLTRQELADRYGLPVKTPAEWATKGTGPRYAKIGRHVRYRLSDVIDWERKRFNENKRFPA